MDAPLERRELLLRPPPTPGGRYAVERARTLHGALDRRAPEARALAIWLERNLRDLGLDQDLLPGIDGLDHDKRAALSQQEWQDIGAAIDDAASWQSAAGPCHVDDWVQALAATLALETDDRRVLELLLHYDRYVPSENLFDALSESQGWPNRLCWNLPLVASLLGMDAQRVAKVLGPAAPLIASGVVGVGSNRNMWLLRALSALLGQDVAPQADVHAQLLGSLTGQPLEWDAFSHLGQEAEVAARILRAALDQRTPGVGILLYGPPGTGKTAFAATLAHQVGASLRPIGEAGYDDSEPERFERLAALRLAHRLAAHQRALLLFDEAEDLFTQRRVVDGEVLANSRVFIHRVLEQGAVPVIWTANDIERLGPAVLRRMTMCIEVKVPDVAARKRLWHRIAAAEGVGLTEAEALRLARLVPAAPAVAAASLRAARLAGGGAETARLVVEGVARAVSGGTLAAPEPGAEPSYDPSLLNADCDLAALEATLTRPGAPRAISFLLSGPPGAGKSAWVRHLAGKMGLQVLQRRASDLLGAYVGSTERNIAATFTEARDTNAFLVFDEADSLLLDRETAVRGWEISQVNEMLTWMETHPLPFACTTNLVDRLDRASLRRFLVKLRFGWLTEPQAAQAFRLILGQEPPPALAALRTLTPSDFTLVRRRAALEGLEQDPEALLRLLASETEGRVGGRGVVGFART